MTSRSWVAAALPAVLLGLLGLTMSGAVRVGAYQADDKSKAGERPRPGAKELPASLRAEAAELKKTAAAFSAAYNKGDLEAVLGFWTEDAELIRESGKTFSGREAIRSVFKKSLAENKGNKQSIRATSVRFIKPDVASTEGVVTVTTPEGAVDEGRYAALLVKQGGKWLFSSVRDVAEPDDQEKPVAANQLKPLGWLVGEWHDRDAKGQVSMSVQWGPGQTYLIQQFTVKHANGKETHTSQRIGYDPREERLRSWLFDSSGGFGGGFWTRKGNSWELDSEGVLPDGRVSTSNDTWKFIDDNTVEWSSKDREADEVPQQDLRVVFVRTDKVKGR
jgi:uncharacterized protein (TIGR02246 family)